VEQVHRIAAQVEVRQQPRVDRVVGLLRGVAVAARYLRARPLLLRHADGVLQRERARSGLGRRGGGEEERGEEAGEPHD
jgi:hypothetical protein